MARPAQRVTTILLRCYHLELHCTPAVYSTANALGSTAAGLGDQYLNPGPPKYTAEEVTTRPRHCVILCLYSVACRVTQKPMSYLSSATPDITRPKFLRHSITLSVLPGFRFVANTLKPNVNLNNISTHFLQQRKHNCSVITNSNRSMMFNEKIAVVPRIITNMMREKMQNMFNDKAGGTHSYRCALKGKYYFHNTAFASSTTEQLH